MADADAWIVAIRSSHDRIAALLEPLDDAAVEGQSYDSEWSIADVASHLGSQAEIFDGFVAAGLEGSDPPGNDSFGPIWDRWNALAPAEQVAESIAANAAFVSRLEQIPPAAREAFQLSVFGRELDLAGLAGMRLSEHALHTWDIAVALDPTAEIASDVVDLLIDTVAGVAGRMSPVAGIDPVGIVTTEPTRRFTLSTAPAVELAAAGTDEGDPLELPAAALIRLVYGRLDPAHSPVGLAGDDRLIALRTVFPGF
jgi:uncharacterized protein (TIGR03083 family)